MNVQWRVVEPNLLGVCVGAGVIFVCDPATGQFRYTCTCTRVQGTLTWFSSPPGNASPPPGIPADAFP